MLSTLSKTIYTYMCTRENITHAYLYMYAHMNIYLNVYIAIHLHLCMLEVEFCVSIKKNKFFLKYINIKHMFF